MRTGGTFNTAATASPPSSSVRVPHNPWHSPVPYLFGGLAAMLGLIAFALLILACSYWKLSGHLEGGEGNSSSEGDSENGDEKAGEAIKIPRVFEEKIVVIMAGDEKPTFLATPICSRASSFGDNNSNNSNKESEKKSEKTEKSKEDNTEEEEEERTENRVVQ